MAENNRITVEKYIVTLRVIQPARIQEIIKAYAEIWDVEATDNFVRTLRSIHQDMKSTGDIVSVRRGTYVLTGAGMAIAAKVSKKERHIDNARIFLMKDERKRYRKLRGGLDR